MSETRTLPTRRIQSRVTKVDGLERHDVGLGWPVQPAELAGAYVLLASDLGSDMTRAVIPETGRRDQRDYDTVARKQWHTLARHRPSVIPTCVPIGHVNVFNFAQELSPGPTRPPNRFHSAIGLVWINPKHIALIAAHEG